MALAMVASTALADPPVRVRARDAALGRVARGVPAGGRLRVEGLRLGRTSATLDLERFEVWAPDAVVLVDGTRRAAPQTAYFRGTVDGDAESVVLLAVRPGDVVAGLVFHGGEYHGIGRARRTGGLRSRKVDLASVDGVPFGCESEMLPRVPDPAGLVSADDGVMASGSAETAASSAAYTARIAVETDYEYFAKFNDATRALDYMGDLIGYASVLYSREVNTSLVISWSRLWTGGAASDPWTVTSNTSNALNEFLTYWRANMGGVSRTVAHMLSGKGLGGGIAYLSVLCDTQYGYGLSANIDGTFNWDGDMTHDPANVVWDIIVVSHEIGHNFGSPHTHDYCNYGGSAEPVDRCYQGCAGGGTGLPACSASPTAFRSGGGSGTIMSYCHLLSGGYGNIAMTFGQAHPCGTLPDRVPAQMRAHVTQRASQYPSCLAAATTCGNGVVEGGEACEAGALGGATCATFGCTGGTLACNGTCTDFDTSGCTGCPPCDRDGVCEAGEDCHGCPGDCPGGTTSGAVCGNGICEAGNGEDCVACPADCAGRQGGKPSTRYCCGDGAGSGPIPCSDGRCAANGLACTTVPSLPNDYCCGDGVCANGESCGTCRLDCTLGAEICTGGVDEDCDGAVDCADSQCSTNVACQATCQPSGVSCTTNAECCSQSCVTKGKSGTKCR
jgi:hypothetical protein